MNLKSKKEEIQNWWFSYYVFLFFSTSLLLREELWDHKVFHPEGWGEDIYDVLHTRINIIENQIITHIFN